MPLGFSFSCIRHSLPNAAGEEEEEEKKRRKELTNTLVRWMQTGIKEKKNKRQRKREKKIDAHFGARFIHSFCSPLLLLFSSVESAHIPTNSTRHVCPLVYVLVYYTTTTTTTKTTITTTAKSSEKKKTERKEVSNQHALGIKIFIIPVEYICRSIC